MHSYIEFIPVKRMEIDCNAHFLTGYFVRKSNPSGRVAYEFISQTVVRSTRRGCPEHMRTNALVTGQRLFVPKGQLPVVLYIPQGLELYQRAWVRGPRIVLHRAKSFSEKEIPVQGVERARFELPKSSLPKTGQHTAQAPLIWLEVDQPQTRKQTPVLEGNQDPLGILEDCATHRIYHPASQIPRLGPKGIPKVPVFGQTASLICALQADSPVIFFAPLQTVLNAYLWTTNSSWRRLSPQKMPLEAPPTLYSE